MKGSKSHEVEADGVPASELWDDIYAGLGFVQLFHKLLPQVLRKVDVVRGDGGVGTVLQVTLVPPGNPAGPEMTYQEEFVKIDHENRVKETLAIEGDVLKLGFTTYVTRLEIIEKGPSSSAIRSALEYEFDDGHPEIEDAASTAPLDAAAEKIAQYLKEQKDTQAST
ncbi:hypothetical protein C2845_PM15G20340 [Panicum miliaceum]|uniref:Bet v I/Major latex protein domain-containing protein n=1 Tax=Panicum miliaceum TaxID=4540 RepID=A0A3L6Q9G1_PANMI|nr:hypothetical protein C2845_PM15G20340 [Panicum miliaceum]